MWDLVTHQQRKIFFFPVEHFDQFFPSAVVVAFVGCVFTDAHTHICKSVIVCKNPSSQSRIQSFPNWRDTYSDCLCLTNTHVYLKSNVSDNLQRCVYKQSTQQITTAVAENQPHPHTNTSRHVLMALTAMADAHICSAYNTHMHMHTHKHAQGWVINLTHVTFNCYNKQ